MPKGIRIESIGGFQEIQRGRVDLFDIRSVRVNCLLYVGLSGDHGKNLPGTALSTLLASFIS